ncbi:MAG: Kae1-associated serine/threonine protein kinase [Thermoplasmata archaeon]|nr:Kae1-associated serine/threonine protein kinase [Thermoplasmata archaeon]MCI4359997.1 Kae1-associated serine/threonine protein kinase [Thermoplasmata archaeon]
MSRDALATEPVARSGRPVARGAEATLRAVDWWGFPALQKERDPKGYRAKALDDRLRRERTRTEARLLVEARQLGVRTPLIYDLDLTRHRIVLEELPGPTLKTLLEEHRDSPDDLRTPVRAFGRALGRLHEGSISHGDLTSSNVLYPDGPSGAPAFIDLSMGTKGASLEELGIDLHLVREDLRGLHPQGERLLESFYEGYAEGNPKGEAAVKDRAKAIQGRVRYA